MSLSVYTAVLSRAAEMLGGKTALRSYLRVSIHELDAWMEGRQAPPRYVFLKAVDVISAPLDASHASLASRSRELRREAGRVVSVAREVREKADDAVARAAAAVQRSKATLASLLERGGHYPTARSKVSVQDFVAADFAPAQAGEMIDAALNAAVGSTSAARGNIQLAGPEGLRIVGQLGFAAPFLDFFRTVRHDTPSACGPAHQRAARVVVAEVPSHPLFVGTPAAPVMEGAGVRAVQSTPLVSVEGQVIGMLSTHYETPHEASPEELQAIDLVAQRTAFWLAGGEL